MRARTRREETLNSGQLFRPLGGMGHVPERCDHPSDITPAQLSERALARPADRDY